MATTMKSLRLPEALRRDIEREVRRRGLKEWSAGAVELLTEAIQMRRAPGIAFVDAPGGRRAVIAGTGLEVWEVIATWRSLDRSHKRLQAAYDWLAEPQLRAALSYYELYPEAVDARLKLEAEATPAAVRRRMPFTVARG